MDRRTVQLHIAGQSYKVMSTSPEADLRRLASKVDEKVSEVTPRGRPSTANSVLLAAMALAHELEEERARRVAVERKTRDLLRRALVRIDDVLDGGARRTESAGVAGE
jgi:cell division protein ZapA